MIARLWRGSAPLTATAVLMIVVLAGALVGLIVDPRTITGVPVWLKPAKFAVSILVYTATLAWIFTLIPHWARTRHIVGWTTALTLIVEIVIISGQAFRGVASHFNVGTPLDAALFGIMGAAILAQTLTSIAVAAALWRTRLSDGALGWALRIGITTTIAGALVGGLMARPTAAQLEGARAGQRLAVVGAHTVGAPDGGPGLPGTGWSTDHGDLRVPHFLGLHALQALVIMALLLRRTAMGDRARVRLTLVASISYIALFGILLAQALSGDPVLAPDPRTAALLIVWGFATAAAATLVAWRLRPAPRTAIG